MLVQSNNLQQTDFWETFGAEFEDNFQISTIKETFTFKIVQSLLYN